MRIYTLITAFLAIFAIGLFAGISYQSRVDRSIPVCQTNSEDSDILRECTGNYADGAWYLK